VTKIRSTRSSRVQDRRGQGGGGGGLSFPGLGGGGGLGLPMKAGGGIVALIVAVAALFLPKLLGGNQQQLAGGDVAPEVPAAEGETRCETELEQILCGAVEDVSEYWIRTFPTAFGQEYREAPTVFFSGGTNTGCGAASADLGPFYCPADGIVYFDLQFLERLQAQLGATGDLAAQYIVAHEYGHHVQNVLGISAKVRQLEQQDPQNANRYSVALELQADCLAGVWSRDADERTQLEQGEIAEALNAAAAVGDDTIQQQAGQQVNQETFTHGSSEQRVQWTRRGYDTGDPQQCNTFAEVL
jgi:predicted metalloprotease